ncbi:hypothetical protein [Kiritimatiella glycovorans]|uniref:CinA C-terminal domain-containing protein n=1 Tax=Kiritimatiella glycovorans TaxID=1307763 RepID=A0A0G3EE67_9BACT|nr:hypothetical protein [Kiritimatiella glycovorans]AKJ64751.1 hypothetical protein L21SP4_01506 [Kiritimatiella glycovorans]
MKAAERNPLVEQIHTSGRTAVILVSGGGTRAIEALMSRPGASRFVAEVGIPYCTAALEHWIGSLPPQIAGEEAARAMARAAYERARSYAEERRPLGLSCTAALHTLRERRGEDRAHLAAKGCRGEAHVEVRFESATRAAQERELEEVILRRWQEFIGRV